MKTTRTLIAFAALAALGGGAFAQATITHSKALAGKVTPGDSAGYPVTLSQPGHYKLTGNLVVPAGTTGVEITANGVTLDLNGFSIAGPMTCSQNTTSLAVACSAAFSASGPVGVKGGDNVVVRNGEVRGFVTSGILLKSGVIENVNVLHDGFGISIDEGRVSATTAKLNWASGIVAYKGLIERSLSLSNGAIGLFGSMNTTAVDSVSVANGNFGAASLKLRGVSLSDNKTNKMSVISLGGNADGNTPF